jgi:hypothetical protein
MNCGKVGRQPIRRCNTFSTLNFDKILKYKYTAIRSDIQSVSQSVRLTVKLCIFVLGNFIYVYQEVWLSVYSTS